jgi:bifunctional non-homologous end joining protein LigD
MGSGTGITKLDLVRYYLDVAEGALRGVRNRPMTLKRFVKGIAQEAVFQKRVPEKRPEWIDSAELHYARGTSAREAVVTDAASLAWVVNLGCIDLNPHPVRAADLDHPDELRIDLDPVPGVPWQQIVEVALVVRAVLEDYGLTAWPKTSGSRGFHIYAPVAPQWTFREMRLAAETVAREVEQRAPDLATSRWWKEERHGVFVDFNQNAKDRTMASAYSVRATPDARVSTPLHWDEVPGCRPEEFTIWTVPHDSARAVTHGGVWTKQPALWGRCWSSPRNWARRRRRLRALAGTAAANLPCRSSRWPAPRPNLKPKQPLRSGTRGIRIWPISLSHKISC